MREITLGAHIFKIFPVKPRRSFPLQAELFPLVIDMAATLARISAKVDGPDPGGKKDETPPPDAEAKPKPFELVARLYEKEVEEILPLFQGAFNGLSYERLAFIQKELLSEVLANGERLFADERGAKADRFDAIMAGRTLDTWRLMWEALKETYPDFLRPLLARFGRGEGAEAPVSAT